MAAYFRPKMIEFPEENVKVRINLWDTAGQERFQSLTRQYIQGASGVILVYDVTDSSSLQGAQNWYSMLKDQIDPESLVVALIGNKTDDFERAEVSKKDAQALGQSVGANIQNQVSAKTGLNIEKMFQDIGMELIRRDNLVSTDIKLKKMSLIAHKYSVVHIESPLSLNFYNNSSIFFTILINYSRLYLFTYYVIIYCDKTGE